MVGLLILTLSYDNSGNSVSGRFGSDTPRILGDGTAHHVHQKGLRRELTHSGIKTNIPK